MRCDLHVHSWHSGKVDLPILEHVGRECYSDPLEVYERARSRGMDLVTLTDHDTIEGALRLAHLPATFVSEEVTVRLEGGRRLHVNVFDLGERQHLEVQRRSGDPEALFAFLAEARLPAAVNHLFSALTGERTAEDLRLPLGRLPLVEALNGAMPAGHNRRAGRVGRAAGMAPVGGSDAHSLTHVARAYTRVPGARSKAQFLEGLRYGLTLPVGRAGSYARLTAEVGRIVATGYGDAARAVLSGAPVWPRAAGVVALLPLLPLLPLFTLAVHAHELVFAARRYRELRLPSSQPAHSSLGDLGTTLGEAA